ncbi:MAG: hypothetical protein HC802_01450 [Caldilineaceae bacterium]|nr:hypothetical protein [Caldilineaceae bacterium]
MTGLGLLVAVSAALIGIVQGGFFKGVWWEIGVGEVALDFGTPVLFDLGVFMVVVSVVTSFLLGLSTLDEEDSA